MFKTLFKHFSFTLLLALASVGIMGCAGSDPVVELDPSTQDLIPAEYPILSDSNLGTIDSPIDFFSDPLLKEYIKQALAQNLNLKSAFENLQQTKLSLSSAASAGLPQVDLALQHNYTSFSNQNGNSKAFGYSSNAISLGFNATWEIDIWNKLGSAEKAQQAAYLYSAEGVALMQSNIVSQVATLYYQLISNDQKLSIYNSVLALMDSTVQVMQEMMNAGEQTAVAVEQAKASYFSAQLSLLNLQTQIKQTENALNILLSQPVGGKIERNSENSYAVPETLFEGIPVEWLRNRPDVLQAEFNFKQAWALTDVAKAQLYPSLRLQTGFVGYRGDGYSNLFDVGNLVANLIGGITQPLFHGNELSNQVKINESRQKAAAYNFQQTLLNAGQEVTELLLRMQTAKAKQSLRQQQISSLQKSVDFNRDLMQAGEASYLEILSAQQQWLNAELSQVDDLLAEKEYSINLYKALGGGRVPIAQSEE